MQHHTNILCNKQWTFFFVFARSFHYYSHFVLLMVLCDLLLHSQYCGENNQFWALIMNGGGGGGVKMSPYKLHPFSKTNNSSNTNKWETKTTMKTKMKQHFAFLNHTFIKFDRIILFAVESDQSNISIAFCESRACILRSKKYLKCEISVN